MLCVVLWACETVTPPEVDPGSDMELSLQLDKQVGEVNKTAQAGALSFTGGFVFVEEIEFEARPQSGGKIEFEQEQRFQVNLNPDSAIALPNPLNLLPGPYERIELEIELEGINDGPAVVLEGNFVNSSMDTVPLRLEISNEIRFKAKVRDVVLGTDSTLMTVLDLRPVDWCQVVSLDALEAADTDADGTVVISRQQNAALYESIIRQLDRIEELRIKGQRRRRR